MIPCIKVPICLGQESFLLRSHSLLRQQRDFVLKDDKLRVLVPAGQTRQYHKGRFT